VHKTVYSENVKGRDKQRDNDIEERLIMNCRSKLKMYILCELIHLV
jgi:hypothetical protein